MIKKLYRLLLITLCFSILSQNAWAAPPTPALQQVRYFASGDSIRVVLDMNAPVQYVATQQEDGSVTVELGQAVIKEGLPPLAITDSSIAAVQLVNAGAGKKAQVVVQCRAPVSYKAFSLVNPNRIVIDFTRIAEKKTEHEIVPGIRYTSWYKSGKAGPLNIHILDIAPNSGYKLEPTLIRQTALGTEPLSHVLLRSDVIAAVNASYFAPSGDIIGLLKIDDELISSSNLSRTALGISDDGKMLIDQVSYQGTVEFPDGTKHVLSGVNEVRGENGLVLFNRFYGQTTQTNTYGMEYTIIAGAISAIQPYNSPIPPNGYVLSAHGEVAKQLSSLKCGDSVSVAQSLGPIWDQVPQVLGAGPMLVKQGNVFVTTKLEEFGSDVAGGRAPRTAVALTQEGRILLVVVDGRQALSKGMTLVELALFLRELGAVQAMNLDGGGSSEMIVKGRIVNKPSDGKERRVGNALAVVPAKLAI